MNGYDNDARVDWINPYYCLVHGDDKYDVAADQPGKWYVSPSLDSNAGRDAQRLRDSDACDAWARETTAGPFPSSDAAIASLIGAPR
jgi:hypothetical protein